MIFDNEELVDCSGGFFTMHHDVVDVADRLMPLYTTLDVPSLTYLVTHVLPTFEHHWKDLVAVVDIAGSDKLTSQPSVSL